MFILFSVMIQIYKFIILHIIFSTCFCFTFRSTYSQELKKIKESKKSGAGADTIYIPSVKWFSILDGSLRNINTILTESESNLVSIPLFHIFNISSSSAKVPILLR